MYSIFYPYFENVEDGTEQRDFLKEFGNDETQGGICLHLVIAWLSLCKKNGNKTPNEIWREMKNPGTIQQIANNQREYQEQKLSIDDCVELAGNLQAGRYCDFNNVEDLKQSCVSPNNLYVILFKNANVGHALASIEVNNKFYLFDPNIGVMTVNAVNKNELLEKVFVVYKNISKGDTYVIQ